MEKKTGFKPKGIIPAVITPLTNEGRFNEKAMRKLLNYLIDGALCYGATGSIASCANAAPRLCVDIYERFIAGDLKGSLRAQFSLAPLRIAFNLGTFPAVIKESLDLLGIEAGPCIEPAGPLTNDERAKLRGVLTDMGLLK